MRDVATPVDISQRDMKELAEFLENYLIELEDVMIIPDEILKKDGKNIAEGIKIVKSLIKKLKKGDKSVFKDEDQWNSIM